MPKYALLLLLSLSVAMAQDLLQPALTPDHIDWEGCTYQIGEAEPVPMIPDLVRSTFGWNFEYGAVRAWRIAVGQRSWPEGAPVHFTIALTAPTPMGSVQARGARLEWHDGESWHQPARLSAQASPLLPLPPDAKATQLRLTMTVNKNGRFYEPSLTTYRQRLADHTPYATANAKAEFTVRPRMGPPFTLSASNLVRGRGVWQNVGAEEGEDRVLHRPPISDVAPSWIVLSWPEPVTLHGLQILGNLTEVEIHSYRGPEHLNPAVAGDRDWQRARNNPTQSNVGRNDSLLRITLQEPVTTRGLRVRILRTKGGPIARIERLLALQALGDGPAPEMTTTSKSAPPYRINYELPADGTITIVIDGPDGRPIRNLLARRDRDGGLNAEPWNLRTDSGVYVTPGTYTYRAIWNPGLQMRYEMTPYPNISEHAPENAPWLTGKSGTGGWLADHTAPRAITTHGDRVWIGSPTAEGGVAMLEADLQGRKLWGHHNFMAWTGPHRMAYSDGQLFVHAFTGGDDHIWQIDLEERRTQEIFTASSTARRGRGIRGLVAIGDHLYMSVRASDRSGMENAFGAADVDIGASWPKYKPKDERDDYGPDMQQDFMRLFRLTGTPPGQRGTLLRLSTTKGPEAKQHLVLAMKRDVPLGSIVLPWPTVPQTAIYLSSLKADAPWPPDPDKDEHWNRWEIQPEAGWTAIPAPPETRTRAIRMTFHKGGDEELSGLLEELQERPADAWNGQVDGMKLLRRRFAPAPEPAIRVNSGEVKPDGSWDAHREEPLSPTNPGIYVMEWEEAQQLRGLAIKEIDGKETRIDVFTGDGPINLTGDAGWEEVATYEQQLRYYYQPAPERNHEAIYMDGYVDFGREVETRAVRLRVVAQWTERAEGRAGQYGVREDRGGKELQPSRCRVYGVLGLTYLGGEPAVDAMAGERLEVFNWRERKMEREMSFQAAHDLYLGPDNIIYGLTGKIVVRVDPTSGEQTPIVSDLLRPQALAISADGSIFVFDAAPERRNVRIYSADGTFQRTLGIPGGFQAGPWEPRRMGNVVDMAIDSESQLWLVERQSFPKRVTRWTLDGTFLAEHFGRTEYGGGGVLDPRDKSLLYSGPMEFELDWESGRTRLKGMTYLGPAKAGEQPIYIDDRKYLVTRDRFFTDAIAIVYRYADGIATPAAAIGLADKFPPIKQPAIMETLGDQALAELQFVWSDLNSDGEVQVDEVELSPRTITRVTNVDSTLSVSSGNHVWEVERFLPSGVPIYAHRVLPLPPNGMYYKLQDGTWFSFGEAAVYRDDGTRLWPYPTEGTGVHAYYSAAPLSPEQVVSEFSIVGHGIMTDGDLGEYVVTSSNSGIWHIWTRDGLLASNIFLDIRHPLARHWNMSAHDRNMLLENLTASQEHFWGDVTQTADGNVYGIWMSTNVFRVDGMDQFKRLSGTIEVTEEDLQNTLTWEQTRQAETVYNEAKLHLWRPAPQTFRIDGHAEDWEKVQRRTLFDDSHSRNAWFRAAYDQHNLYLLYETKGLGPLLNSGEDWRRLFKSGAVVDLMLGTNPQAPGNRRHAVAGDLRLLMTRYRGTPTAILFEALVPDAPEADAQTYETQVFRTTFSRVRQLDAARLAVTDTEDGYIVEAAIPLQALGLEPEAGITLKMDWGLLRTGEEGRDVLGRHYWSNQATSILSDIAAEAMLTPNLWGHLRFATADEGSGPRPTLPGEEASDPLIDEMLEDFD